VIYAVVAPKRSQVERVVKREALTERRLCWSHATLGGSYPLSVAIARLRHSFAISQRVRATSFVFVGKEIGTLRLSDSDRGLLISPQLKGLPPGIMVFMST
jgi:hypothetical protein